MPPHSNVADNLSLAVCFVFWVEAWDVLYFD